MRGRACLRVDGVKKALLILGRKIADLDGGKHLHALGIDQGKQFGNEERQAYEALYLGLTCTKLFD